MFYLAIFLYGVYFDIFPLKPVFAHKPNGEESNTHKHKDKPDNDQCNKAVIG